MKEKLKYPFFALNHAFINDESKLSVLFRAYLDTLFTATSLSWDMWLSLSEATEEAKAARKVTTSMILFDKMLAWQSFVNIIDSTRQSIEQITEFEEKYNSDLIYYASQKRIEAIEEFGGEPDEFDEDGNILFTDDLTALTYYTLKNSLSHSIEIESSGCRGEKVGTSTIEDLEDQNFFVKNATEFGFFKFLRSTGSSLTPSVLMPDGTMQPLSLADEVEREMNEDIANEQLIDQVGTVLDYGREIADKLNFMHPFENPQEYIELKSMLQNLLDLNIN